MKKRMLGFSLMEVVLVVVGMGLLMMAMSRDATGVLDFAARADTKRRLVIIQSAGWAGYQQNIGVAEANAGAEMTWDGVTIKGAPLDTVVADPFSATGSGQWNDPIYKRRLAKYAAAGDANQFELDGHNRPWRLWVSPRLTRAHHGTTLFYHKLAMVSAGQNGRVESTMTSAGDLTLGGDDQGVVIDGFEAQKEALETTEARLDQLQRLLQTYYQARYLADPSRDPARNYYSNADPTAATSPSLWDAGGPIAPLAAATPIEGSGVPSAIGAGGGVNLQSAWPSTPIRLETVSTRARHPANGTMSMASPPYSAWLSVALPWYDGSSATEVTRVAVSSY